MLVIILKGRMELQCSPKAEARGTLLWLVSVAAAARITDGMAQWAKVTVVQPDDLGSIPGRHMEKGEH